jgi:hypothetical protein
MKIIDLDGGQFVNLSQVFDIKVTKYKDHARISFYGQGVAVNDSGDYEYTTTEKKFSSVELAYLWLDRVFTTLNINPVKVLVSENDLPVEIQKKLHKEREEKRKEEKKHENDFMPAF